MTSSSAVPTVKKLNNHFCAMHVLVNLAEQANDLLLSWEKSQNLPEPSGNVIVQSGEAGTVRLVRTACKTFEKHGSEFGAAVDFAAFAHDIGVHDIPLAHFKGNRFNILFYNAAGVFHLSQHMNAFLEIHATNKLQRAVTDDTTEVYLDGCRALGLIGKYFTSPFVRFLETDMTMAEAHGIYQAVVTRLGEWSDDPSGLLEGGALLFPGAHVHTSVVLDSLLKPQGEERVKRVCDL